MRFNYSANRELYEVFRMKHVDGPFVKYNETPLGVSLDNCSYGDYKNDVDKKSFSLCLNG